MSEVKVEKYKNLDYLIEELNNLKSLIKLQDEVIHAIIVENNKLKEEIYNFNYETELTHSIIYNYDNKKIDYKNQDICFNKQK